MASTIPDEVIYSDFLMDFDIHPVKQDLVRAVNEAAVKRSMRNLLLTRKGERFFDYEKGSDIERQLFENMTPQTTDALKASIENVLNNYEPRAKVVEVKVVPLYDQNAYAIKIMFYIINRPDPIIFNVTLERTR